MLDQMYIPGVRCDCNICKIMVTREEGKCCVCGTTFVELEKYWIGEKKKLVDEEERQINENASGGGSSTVATIDWSFTGMVTVAKHGCTTPVFKAFRDTVKPLYDANHADWDKDILGTLDECVQKFYAVYCDEKNKTDFLNDVIRNVDKDDVLKNIVQVIKDHASR